MKAYIMDINIIITAAKWNITLARKATNLGVIGYWLQTFSLYIACLFCYCLYGSHIQISCFCPSRYCSWSLKHLHYLYHNFSILSFRRSKRILSQWSCWLKPSRSGKLKETKSNISLSQWTRDLNYNFERKIDITVSFCTRT